MKPIHFDQVNITIAASQPEYGDLPAHYEKADGTVTCCLKLSLDEVASLVEKGEIFIQVKTFGQPLQPLAVHTENPLTDNPKKED